MCVGGATDLISKPGFDFFDVIRSTEFRYRKVRRFISKGYHILLETYDVRNVCCLSSTCPSFVFSLLDGSVCS